MSRRAEAVGAAAGWVQRFLLVHKLLETLLPAAEGLQGGGGGAGCEIRGLGCWRRVQNPWVRDRIGLQNPTSG